jgi:hypothetical protein
LGLSGAWVNTDPAKALASGVDFGSAKTLAAKLASRFEVFSFSAIWFSPTLIYFQCGLN